MIVAATGHRPEKLGGHSVEVASRLAMLALKHIHLLKPDEVISGMALGWDTAVAEACVIRNIPFIAAVPFAGQEAKWSPVLQATYRALLRAARRVEIVSPGGYAPWKMHVRNKWMVDRADHILALWDGGREGGTAGCIRAARQKKLSITNVWDEWSANGPRETGCRKF